VNRVNHLVFVVHTGLRVVLLGGVGVVERSVLGRVHGGQSPTDRRPGGLLLVVRSGRIDGVVDGAHFGDAERGESDESRGGEDGEGRLHGRRCVRW